MDAVWAFRAEIEYLSIGVPYDLTGNRLTLSVGVVCQYDLTHDRLIMSL